MPRALWIGIVLSLLWVLFVGAYLFSSTHSLAAVWDKQPNEFGDFLAGIFAPLAFLWLAVAVFVQREELELQRKELTHNREALTLQAEELRRTVEENAAQARALRASEEYQRQEIIIHVTESTFKTLALLACNMWHHLRGYRREGGAVDSPSAFYWERYANGDREIWFAATLTALGLSASQKKILNPELSEQATAFEQQCASAQRTLESLGAPESTVSAFSEGLVNELRTQLSSLGVIRR
jgi:hypothetical protein